MMRGNSSGRPQLPRFLTLTWALTVFGLVTMALDIRWGPGPESDPR